eukprot:EG_transcript_32811
MAVLLWRAYLAFKRDPLVTLYEQGHLNTVFLLEGKLKYTLTHLTLLDLQAAKSVPMPAAFALIHFSGSGTSARRKAAAMRPHFHRARAAIIPENYLQHL